jgi:hypothetical protein
MASGASSITRYPSETVLNGRVDAPLVAHELGHAVGLYHSLTLDCDGGVQEGTCTRLQDDAFDVMGSSPGLAYPNALHRERLGWLATSAIQTASADGTYTIAPYELTGTATPRALKVFKDLEPGTNVPRWYYIEYRQAIGADSWLSGDPLATAGVLVRYGISASDLYANAGSDLSTMLLDMTPGSSQVFYTDRHDPALQVGSQFVDSVSGLKVTLLWADGATAGIQVSGAKSPPSSTVTGTTTANRAPLAINDSGTTSAGVAVEIVVLANDSDPDGDRLVVSAISKPAQGSVALNADGSVVYVPSKTARKSDSFSYTVSDGRATATATVSVTIASTSGTGKKGR